MKRVHTVTLLLLVAALTSCGTTEAPGADGAEPTPAEQAITVELVTDDGSIGQNHDDEYCVWRNPEYVLRDGSGDIIATGTLESVLPGEAEAGGEPAQLGQVHSTEPYECTMAANVTAPESDFYELEVTATEIAGVTYGEGGGADFEQTSATVTFSLEDAQEVVEVEF
ncbi:hypothetical protein [Nocardiopsis sp. NPDC057823]|uniref:hypothetical protein n=1 Tax=Nocardiopsis sp. NPDC057823 TaxID=3346256 RepID=UPI003670B3B5